MNRRIKSSRCRALCFLRISVICFVVAPALFCLFQCNSVNAQTGFITTFAGSGSAELGKSTFDGEMVPSTEALLLSPGEVFVSDSGDIFILDGGNRRIRKVNGTTGVITTVAGPGIGIGLGNGSPAIKAQLGDPVNVFVDTSGNIFIAEAAPRLIRKVDAETGIITTVAGGGTAGDGSPAVVADIGKPEALFVDNAGNIFISSSGGDIRKVDGTTGIISTVMDGSGSIRDIFVNNSGEILFTSGNIVNKVDVETGRGVPIIGFSPGVDGISSRPGGIFVDNANNIFVTDISQNVIHRVDGSTGAVTTVAGNGVGGFSGDGGFATDAMLSGPQGVSLDKFGNIFIADTNNNRIRKITFGDGPPPVPSPTPLPTPIPVTITVVVEASPEGFIGDGGPAAKARFFIPSKMFLDGEDNIFIADRGNHRIRKIDARTGIITTVAGDGSGELRGTFSGDGGLATSASLFFPQGGFVDEAGNIFIADALNHRVRKVDSVTGIISTIAGIGLSPEDGLPKSNGDGGPATEASLIGPQDLFVDKSGNIFIATILRIRRVDAETGIITTVAGGDGVLSSGNIDGAPATDVLFSTTDVTLDRGGNIFIPSGAIFRVDADSGILTIVAGGGSTDVESDLAINATIGAVDVAIDSSGNLLVPDRGHCSIRKVDLETGLISTIVGDFDFCDEDNIAGIGDSATDVPFVPDGIALDSEGNMIILDTTKRSIFKVSFDQNTDPEGDLTPEETPTPTPISSQPTTTVTPVQTPPPSGKSFTFNCEHNLKSARLSGLEKLTLELGEMENCTLKLSNHEPGKTVEISSLLRKGLKSSIKIVPSRSVTDANGELEITITAIRKGKDWAAWAVQNGRGLFMFNKKTYDTGLAWGMFVEVE